MASSHPRFVGMTWNFLASLLAINRCLYEPHLPGELWEHVFAFISVPSRLAIAGTGVCVFMNLTISFNFRRGFCRVVQFGLVPIHHRSIHIIISIFAVVEKRWKERSGRSRYPSR